MTFHIFSLALRSLRARPTRTVLTTFGIVLGVAVILAISITNLSTLDAISTVFSEASGKAHLVVTLSSGTDESLPDSLLRRVSGVPGVKAAIPSVHGQALPGDETPSQMSLSLFGTVAAGLTLYGIDPSVDRQTREYKIVAGTFLPPDLDAHEVVLVKDYADEKKLQVGSDLSIRTSGAEETLRVVGLMSKQGPGQLNNGAFGVVPLGVAQKMFGETGRVEQIDIILPAQGVIVSVLLALLVSQLAALWPAQRAAGIRIIEAIQFE